MEQAENRWLPPSPHREEVLRRIQAGRAHIQERGHSVPPLLVFEDGGVIELPRVRYEMTRRGMELVSGDTTSTEGLTRHNDVCGTVDEIKGLLKEQPDLARTQPEVIGRLLDDAAYMLTRMQRRWDAYRTFACGLADAVDRMDGIEGPVTGDALQKADEVRRILSEDPAAARERRDEIDRLAEGVRDVANGLEKTLREFREATMAVSGLLDDIRGGRVWASDRGDASSSG